MKADSSKRDLRHESERATEIVAREAARFIAREASANPLITVVRAQSVAHGDRIIIFVSVFPESRAPAALAFLERQRAAFSDYLKSHSRLSLPRVDFLLDNRELLDESMQ